MLDGFQVVRMVQFMRITKEYCVQVVDNLIANDFHYFNIRVCHDLIFRFSLVRFILIFDIFIIFIFIVVFILVIAIFKCSINMWCLIIIIITVITVIIFMLMFIFM